MYSLRYLRENVDTVRAGIAAKGQSVDLLDEVIDLDRRRRELLTEQEQLRHVVRSTSRLIGSAASKEERTELVGKTRAASAQLEPLDAEIGQLEKTLNHAALSLPNIPHASVPNGRSAEDNPLISSGGTMREFDFEPKTHVELAESLGMIDFARAAKLAGSGFWLHLGVGARLQRTLSNWMLDLQTQENGYTEVYPPAVVRESALIGTGQLPKFADDQYHLAADGLWLIPTAEVPLTNIHADEILAEEDLPICYAGHTPCFRREAGAAGTETRGLLRVHQFDKVELVRICSPDTGFAELDQVLSHALRPIELLDLPYRVIELCSGDLSAASAKTYDIELWAPGTGRWLEVSSVSCFGEYQSRRMNMRTRDAAGGPIRHPFTINGSGLALPRLTVAILENGQQADGSINIPPVLAARLNQGTIQHSP